MTSFFVLGLLLGMRHALDADHLAAMATLVAQGSSTKKCLSKGIFWGIGHTFMLLVFAVAAIFFHWRVSDDLAAYLEMAVGVMLVALGLSVIYSFKRKKIHFHPHQHGDKVHLHLHSHESADHSHSHFSNIPIRPFVIGLVHGTAGSTALILLVLESMQSGLMGLVYVLVFGLGSIVGMAVLATTISVPFRMVPQRFAHLLTALQILTFSCSTLLGGYIIYRQVEILA